ncbi:MAG: hypothetical protein J6W14_04230 [Clostridia bacterium]|nr:hypothetical protein [Clostridia bacterium]
MKKYLSIILTALLLLSLTACGEANAPADTSADIFTQIPLTGESYVYRVEEGVYSAYASGKVIEESRIGEKLEDVTVMGGWRNNSDGTWISQEQLRAELYAIRDISREVAVALKFLDQGDALTTTHYYVIMNPAADLTAVADYVIHTNLDIPGAE